MKLELVHLAKLVEKTKKEALIYNKGGEATTDSYKGLSPNYNKIIDNIDTKKPEKEFFKYNKIEIGNSSFFI